MTKEQEQGLMLFAGKEDTELSDVKFLGNLLGKKIKARAHIFGVKGFNAEGTVNTWVIDIINSSVLHFKNIDIDMSYYFKIEEIEWLLGANDKLGIELSKSKLTFRLDYISF